MAVLFAEVVDVTGTSTVPSTSTPTQVRNRLVADATAGHVISAGAGSANRLLFVH
jgi:hypothetical protein